MNLRSFLVSLLWALLLVVCTSAQRLVFAANAIADTPSGTLYLRRSAQEPVTEALRLATRMQVQVTGNVARVHVQQEFSNTGTTRVPKVAVQAS